jgi:hypothetical protein
MKNFLFSVLTLVAFLAVPISIALAQAPSASPAITPAGQAVIHVVDKASSALPASIPGWALGVIAFLFSEAAARGVPTQKPVSWFLFLEAVVASLIVFLQKAQGMLNTLGSSFQNVSKSP